MGTWDFHQQGILSSLKGEYAVEDILMTMYRTTFSFILLVLATLLFGKHINSHKNHYSFALSITIGSLIANMAFNHRLQFSSTVISFGVLILLFYILLLTSAKSRKWRGRLSGRPTTLMEKGKILEESMRKLKFTMDNLNQQLREQGIFDITEVDMVVLEVSGMLSVRKKALYSPLTPKDMNLAPSPSGPLAVELIMDGKATENLIPPHRDQLLSICRDRGISLDDINYAVVTSSGNIFIDENRDVLR